jgi:hypothetical protein
MKTSRAVFPRVWTGVQVKRTDVEVVVDLMLVLGVGARRRVVELVWMAEREMWTGMAPSPLLD